MTGPGVKDRLEPATVSPRLSLTYRQLSDLHVFALPGKKPLTANPRQRTVNCNISKCTGSHTHSVSRRAHPLRYHTISYVNSAEGHRFRSHIAR